MQSIIVSTKEDEPTGDPVKVVYHYEPLSSGNKTRLLTIEAALDQSEPIQCRLTQSSDLSNDDYQTLSYAWGPTYSDGSHLTHRVVCDGGLIAVTANLHGALLQIRQDYAFNGIDASTLPLWCDALCINQVDLEERSKQVRLMGEIFANSSRLIIWLGTFEHGEVFRILLEYGDDEQRYASLPPAEVHLDILFVFKELLTKSYFTRRWAIQEVFLTPESRRWVFLGDQAFLYQTLERVVERFQLRAATSFFGSWSSAYGPELESDALMPRQTHLRSLLRNLDVFSAAECSDDRDRVFSLLSISTNFEEGLHSVVEPNYALTTEQLYLKLAVRLATSSHHAVGLLACAAARAPTPGCTRSLPSWVPDWRVSTYNGSAIRHTMSMILHDCTPGVNCDGDAKCPYALDTSPYVSSDGKILRILGHVTRKPLNDNDMARRPALTESQTYLLLSSSPTAFLLEAVAGKAHQPGNATFQLLACHNVTYPADTVDKVYEAERRRHKNRRPTTDRVWLHWQARLRSIPSRWISLA
ncbi:hypothetical protein LTR56_005038 [Elasticomyces elasticus]|nr:hypothetical protein LTR56_005038 [Elasticomyces elasticus]KAK3655860.1 hypothetical protein LTR22_010018 [Elasticomyces elasticus]KAK4912587.1 hypothetical protein LTR49_018949 [Elasticomyces elasticus]KAK5752063.1 hypothetical protein LTS12_017826 [Elasticomyces elasticus]